jgi:3-methyladenine DNA glycosylase Tag
LLLQRAVAYDSHVEGNLKYSRDALLKQRSEIEAVCDRKAAQVAQLQSEIDRFHQYLEDTDRSLRNIDSALRGN